MFATLFGLSMDYEVFLLSRVREALAGRALHVGRRHRRAHADRGRDQRRGGDHGRVFGALALAPEVFLKLIGVGLATAVLVDATIVRLVLVPAVMQLLGERNWWMPRWLDRIVPHTELEAPALSRA